MKHVLLLTTFFMFLTSSFASDVKSEKISVKADLTFWTCSSAFSCSQGTGVYNETIELELVKRGQLGEIDYYSSKTSKDLDIIQGKLMGYEILVNKELNTNTNEYSYLFSITLVDHFEGRVMSSDLVIPMNQSLYAGYAISASTGVSKIDEKLIKPVLTLQFFKMK